MSGEVRTDTFLGKCGECGHCWIIAYLPIPLERFAKLAKQAACPKGCKAKVSAANASDVLKAEGKST